MKYRIRHATLQGESGRPLYWSYLFGWVVKKSAMQYPSKDGNMPAGDCFFEPIPEKPRSYEKFEEEFIPVLHGETVCGIPEALETYGPELEKVQAQVDKDPHFVWTVLDCDGKLILAAGFHYVNRFLYVISKNPWVTGEETFYW